MKKLLIILIPITLVIALLWTLRGVSDDKFTFTYILNRIQNIELNDEFADIQEFWGNLGNWENVEFAKTDNGFLDFFIMVGEFFTSLGIWFKNFGLFIYSIINLLIETISNAIAVLKLLLGFE